jgi:hypothetical protein
MLRQAIAEGLEPEQIPRALISRYEINTVTEAVCEALEATGQRIIVLYDRLDEAWLPETTPIAILNRTTRHWYTRDPEALVRSVFWRTHCTNLMWTDLGTLPNRSRAS